MAHKPPWDVKVRRAFSVQTASLETLERNHRMTGISEDDLVSLALRTANIDDITALHHEDARERARYGARARTK